jgi:hypothetical protein
MASSSKAAPKRPARHESKVRYSPELYSALDRFSRENGGASFQSIIEAALREFLQPKTAKRETKALAQMMVDVIDQIDAAPQSFGRRLNAFREYVMERYLEGDGHERRYVGDTTVEYCVRVLSEPRNEAEAALAAYLRALAER